MEIITANDDDIHSEQARKLEEQQRDFNCAPDQNPRSHNGRKPDLHRHTLSLNQFLEELSDNYCQYHEIIKQTTKTESKSAMARVLNSSIRSDCEVKHLNEQTGTLKEERIDSN